MTADQIASVDPSARVAVEGLTALARLGSEQAERLAEHPDTRVRREAALLAASAYPLLLGLTPSL